jgi:hypothetical protein
MPAIWIAPANCEKCKSVEPSAAYGMEDLFKNAKDRHPDLSIYQCKLDARNFSVDSDEFESIADGLT